MSKRIAIIVHTQANHARTSACRFSFTVKPTAVVKYRYRVYDPAVRSYASSASRALALSVTAHQTHYANFANGSHPLVRPSLPALNKDANIVTRRAVWTSWTSQSTVAYSRPHT